MDRPASPQITRERDPGLNDRVSQPAKLLAPDTSSEKRLIELERQLLEMRAAQTELDRHIAQLTDHLVKKGALLEQAEANAAEVKKRAGLVQRELQARLDALDKLLLSRDQALEQARSALQKATFRAAEANERSQPACEHETELAEVHAKLEARESELAAVRLRLTDAEDGWAKSKAWQAEADTLRAQTAAAGLVNTEVDRVMHRLMERMRSMEAEMSLLRGNEKSIESMECRNEG
jgi:chromosome segregation ATPase